jgi:hypothetical protein
MKINEDTGHITLPEIGAIITPSLSRSHFLQLSAFAGASVSVRNEPWCSYRLPDIRQSDTDLTIVVQFHGQQLVSLNLFHGAPRFGSSWSDWSRERELARKAFHECWLATELRTPPGEYPWGGIFSHYDDKGGFSSITVQYANPYG